MPRLVQLLCHANQVHHRHKAADGQASDHEQGSCSQSLIQPIPGQPRQHHFEGYGEDSARPCCRFGDRRTVVRVVPHGTLSSHQMPVACRQGIVASICWITSCATANGVQMRLNFLPKSPVGPAMYRTQINSVNGPRSEFVHFFTKSASGSSCVELAICVYWAAGLVLSHSGQVW